MRAFHAVAALWLMGLVPNFLATGIEIGISDLTAAFFEAKGQNHSSLDTPSHWFELW